jgi:hypothetical protein
MVSQKIAHIGIEDPPFGFDRAATRTLDPSPLARLVARLRACALERALIAGADPAGSPQMAARAAQLTSPRTRAQLAEGLERLLDAAQAPQRRWWALSRRGVVLANAAAIGDLSALLRAETPLYARGVAIVNQLMTDGTGPLHGGRGEELARRLHEARAAMDG